VFVLYPLFAALVCARPDVRPGRRRRQYLATCTLEGCVSRTSRLSAAGKFLRGRKFRSRKKLEKILVVTIRYWVSGLYVVMVVFLRVEFRQSVGSVTNRLSSMLLNGNSRSTTTLGDSIPFPGYWGSIFRRMLSNSTRGGSLNLAVARLADSLNTNDRFAIGGRGFVPTFTQQ